MRDLCEGNGSLLLPVLQASSMLCLAGPLQVSNTDLVLDVLQHGARLFLVSTDVYVNRPRSRAWYSIALTPLQRQTYPQWYCISQNMPRAHPHDRSVLLAALTQPCLIAALTGTPLAPGSSDDATEAEIRR